MVGGSARTPGAVMLAGLVALRVGAGRLSLAVADSAAAALAVACPEAGVMGLAQSDRGSVLGQDLDVLAGDLATADVLLVGLGLDDPDHTKRMLRTLASLAPDHVPWVRDAFALGVLSQLDDVVRRLSGRMVLTPNRAEAERLLDRPTGDDVDDLHTLVQRYGAVVAFRVWSPTAPEGRGRPGLAMSLATSGSGDVMAGALAGLMAWARRPNRRPAGRRTHTELLAIGSPRDSGRSDTSLASCSTSSRSSWSRSGPR